jgi:hypothetical protein
MKIFTIDKFIKILKDENSIIRHACLRVLYMEYRKNNKISYSECMQFFTEMEKNNPSEFYSKCLETYCDMWIEFKNIDVLIHKLKNKLEILVNYEFVEYFQLLFTTVNNEPCILLNYSPGKSLTFDINTKTVIDHNLDLSMDQEIMEYHSRILSKVVM